MLGELKKVKAEFKTQWGASSIELNAALLTVTDKKEMKQAELVLQAMEETFNEMLESARLTLQFNKEKRSEIIN